MQSSQKYSTDGSGSKRSPETIFLPPVVNVLPQTLHCFSAAFSSGVIRAVKENAVVLPLFTGIFSCSQTLDAIRYAASGAAPRSISQERSVRWFQRVMWGFPLFCSGSHRCCQVSCMFCVSIVLFTWIFVEVFSLSISVPLLVLFGLVIWHVT